MYTLYRNTLSVAIYKYQELVMSWTEFTQPNMVTSHVKCTPVTGQRVTVSVPFNDPVYVYIHIHREDSPCSAF